MVRPGVSNSRSRELADPNWGGILAALEAPLLTKAEQIRYFRKTPPGLGSGLWGGGNEPNTGFKGGVPGFHWAPDLRLFPCVLLQRFLQDGEDLGFAQ